MNNKITIIPSGCQYQKSIALGGVRGLKYRSTEYFSLVDDEFLFGRGEVTFHIIMRETEKRLCLAILKGAVPCIFLEVKKAHLSFSTINKARISAKKRKILVRDSSCDDWT